MVCTPPANGVAVEFDCDEVHVKSCKDLSNVVLEFADGSHYKFDDLNEGNEASFAGVNDHDGSDIVGVWVKAGANHSGDGPGYGERFESTACDDGDPSDPSEPTDPSEPSDPMDPRPRSS